MRNIDVTTHPLKPLQSCVILAQDRVEALCACICFGVCGWVCKFLDKYSVQKAKSYFFEERIAGSNGALAENSAISDVTLATSIVAPRHKVIWPERTNLL